MDKIITDTELATIDSKKNVRRSLAEKGINFESGKKFTTVSERLKALKNLEKRALDLKFKAIDNEHEEEPTKEKSVLEKINIRKIDDSNSPVLQRFVVKKKDAENKKKNNKNKNKKKHLTKGRKIKILIIAGSIVISTLALTGVAYASSNIGETIFYENVKKDKMAPYREMLDSVVLSSTHSMRKTFDVGGGEHESYNEYYLDYAKIAKAIKECDNPDLALYTLYHYFGKTNYSVYEGITTRTCKYLDFVNKDGEIKEGDLYDFASGFNKGNKTEEEILDEYDKKCDEELKYDFDSSLDNLEYKIVVEPKTESRELKKTRVYF